ncbi:MAG: NAD-dependent epimerase/dehydratase family protein [Ignavibacteriales bacterium]|nr:NAD-dependent epimerase/dehydratase family protein [Ignavibacteriales bacterium]
MRLLITGGAGFIGSHMAENFVNKGWEVVVLDNFLTGKRENLSHISGKLKIVEGDIRNASIVNEVMEGCDAVIHLAALASVPASFNDPVGTYEVNFMGTQNVLEAAHQNKVKRVTFASSSAVYGDTQTFPITEENPDNPLSPYGVSKLLGEKLCRFYNTAFGLSVVIFRFFNVYGPRQNPFSEYSAVIPKFLSIIKDGGTPTIFGDGEQTRDFIYISDLVHAHEKALDEVTESQDYGVTKSQSHRITESQYLLRDFETNPKGVTSRLRDSVTFPVSASPLNLGSGEKTSLNDLIKIISRKLGTTVTPKYDPPRSGDILHSYCDISRINDILTFKPQVSMEIGIEKMLKYYNLAD